MEFITGPNGEKRPTDPWAAGVMTAKIATGQMDEIYSDEEMEAYLEKIQSPTCLPNSLENTILLHESSIERKEETSPSSSS